jgi:carbamoyltransferase
MFKLGISAFYHDSAACLTDGNTVIAAAEEERFTGIKHDSRFPKNAIKWILRSTVTKISDIQEVHWYENPDTKDDRVKTTFNKRPFKTFFLRQRYNKDRKNNSPEALLKSIGYTGKIIYHDHHYSHAAFSYFTSPYRDAAILTVDGVGEWDTTAIYRGHGNKLTKITSIKFPNSLGMLYSTITAYLGFKPNEGEYKVMGLAPYGDPSKFHDKLDNIFCNTGTKFFIDQKYFTWEYSERIMFNKKFCKLLGIPPRLPEDKLEQHHKDLAAALQKIYEREFLKLVKVTKSLTKSDNLCLGGGCAYNGVANSLAYREFKSVHIPFAPSDAGSAIGACLTGHCNPSPYLGPEFSDSSIKRAIDNYKDKIFAFKLSEDKLISKTAELINAQNIVAWFQGKMEFGARALGNRSILASPRDPKMRERLNYVIKKREGFRPFAPSVIEEQAHLFFDIKEPIPHMNQVVKAKVDFLPAATHVDGTCRVQTVTKQQNEKYWKLLTEIGRLTKIPVVLNTSFNLKDQTITITPDQAIQRFISSEINFLIINNYLIKKI